MSLSNPSSDCRTSDDSSPSPPWPRFGLQLGAPKAASSLGGIWRKKSPGAQTTRTRPRSLSAAMLGSANRKAVAGGGPQASPPRITSSALTHTPSQEPVPGAGRGGSAPSGSPLTPALHPAQGGAERDLHEAQAPPTVQPDRRSMLTQLSPPGDRRQPHRTDLTHRLRRPEGKALPGCVGKPHRHSSRR